MAKKSELKTKPTAAAAEDFVDSIKDEQQRSDSKALLALMKEVTGAEPKMWGSSIVGFGEHHYQYESGREGDWFLAGFSPRKQALTLYLSNAIDEHADLLKKLGKHKTGKGCLYIKSLDDVDMPTLKKLVQRSVKTKR